MINKRFVTEIGYLSVNHVGEELCGDNVVYVEPDEDTKILVLADGLGSGVKANILSTLTAKMLSTMMANNMSIEECVETIAATLPVCSLRGVAYSTFTIIHLKNNDVAEVIQYDNPQVIVIRDEQNYDYPKTEMNIGGKKIFKSEIRIQEGDIFIAMSDGCPHAGIGMAYKDIIPLGKHSIKLGTHHHTIIASNAITRTKPTIAHTDNLQRRHLTLE